MVVRGRAVERARQLPWNQVASLAYMYRLMGQLDKVRGAALWTCS